MSFINKTYDDREGNPSVLSYDGFWFHDGVFNASNTGETGTLSSTSDLKASFRFNFPTPAIAFYYYGIRRSLGGMYGICVDCDPNKPSFVDIDAVNKTDDGHNPPVVLYSQRWDKPGSHVVIIRNQPDGRYNGNSQLTLDRIELEVEGPGLSSSSSPSPSPSSSSTVSPLRTTSSSSSRTVSSTTTLNVIPVPSTTPFQNASSQTLSSSPPSQGPPLNVSAIAGGIGGGLAILMGICVIACLLLRRQRQNEFDKQYNGTQRYEPSLDLGEESPRTREGGSGSGVHVYTYPFGAGAAGARAMCDSTGREGSQHGHGIGSREWGAGPIRQTSETQSTSNIGMRMLPATPPASNSWQQSHSHSRSLSNSASNSNSNRNSTRTVPANDRHLSYYPSKERVPLSLRNTTTPEPSPANGERSELAYTRTSPDLDSEPSQSLARHEVDAGLLARASVLPPAYGDWVDQRP